jgi:oligoendopeptidase F
MMMKAALPSSALELAEWPWERIQPYVQELENTSLNAGNLESWLAGWSRLWSLFDEAYWRLYVAVTVDTTDQEAERRYNEFLDGHRTRSEQVNQRLKEKLLESGLEPANFSIPMRNLRAQAEIFRPENLPLLNEHFKLGSEYDRLIGAQTIVWDGKETTLPQLEPVYQEADRERRQSAWLQASQRALADRQEINDLWGRALQVRRKLAENAGLPDYRAYRWMHLLRFDYTPADCYRFHQAIEEVVVPAARRIYEKRRQRLGLESLRPWDLKVDLFGQPPLRPYQTIDELEAKTTAIFQRVDPQLGGYFDQMRQHKLLDLDNRKGKAPGGYCTAFIHARLPFIFANSVGVHDDVQTLLHEGGHAFHVFESVSLPYIHQMEVPLEFAEVASMGMELLAAPYLTLDQGGFYTPAQAARARTEHLESVLLFWPYMAVVDSFQHWTYENPEQAADPARCDTAWGRLWDRFMQGQDWSGLEEAKVTGWQRKAHIHTEPFYYVEYGLAQLGAVQVWRNALQDQAGAVQAYRRALALGGTASIPGLFAAAGARFAFDAATLRTAVDLMESTLTGLEEVARTG